MLKFLLKLLQVLKEVLDVLNVFSGGGYTHTLTLLGQLSGVHLQPGVEQLTLILSKALSEYLINVSLGSA